MMVSDCNGSLAWVINIDQSAGVVIVNWNGGRVENRESELGNFSDFHLVAYGNFSIVTTKMLHYHIRNVNNTLFICILHRSLSIKLCKLVATCISFKIGGWGVEIPVVSQYYFVSMFYSSWFCLITLSEHYSYAYMVMHIH